MSPHQSDDVIAFGVEMWVDMMRRTDRNAVSAEDLDAVILGTVADPELEMGDGIAPPCIPETGVVALGDRASFVLDSEIFRAAEKVEIADGRRWVAAMSKRRAHEFQIMAS